ncbi:MAG: YeeE/YedE family protein [Candidatus Ruthia sp.]|jgi:uncharacterized membrane protein YedE/YeeE|nr:YeeE/YedE family protein [Candidatus Ruthturnera sp.]MBT4123066.1 YeeE/YedE family protein [Candidatus Ruthturnera sp.]MBT4668141.1 YeeE/YedE family protein [Candidatus Ruthturnera sp.]MBT6921921.1 YeeE/YedE family protein [Candidatus Ruthturnera sp.]
MELELYQNMLMLIFATTFVMGWVVSKTDFCTMGAVSDWVNMGSTARFKSWMLAAVSALFLVTLLTYTELIDSSLTQSNDTASPPYNTPTFAWLRYLIGGLIFGIGMTIGSGCGNKTLVRIGAGNLKSVIIFAMMAFGAYLMMFTDFMYTFFLQWTSVLDVDLTEYDINSQDLGAITAHIIQTDVLNTKLMLGFIISIAALLYLFRTEKFRKDKHNILAGLTIGICVAIAWYISSGPMGQELLEEAEMMDAKPYALGAQSLTFVAPSGHFSALVSSTFDTTYITFALIAGLGVLVGSFFYAILNQSFRLEWFSSISDLINHIVSGLLMGIGGVLGMGCTIGQGVTGVSTLSLGSLIVLGSIVFGSALTMKIRYYQLVYEDEANLYTATMASLADLKCIPNKWRYLDHV